MPRRYGADGTRLWNEYHWQHDELYAVYFGFSCFYVRTGLETWADCGNHYLAGITGCKIYE